MACHHYYGLDYCGENGGNQETCPRCKADRSFQGKQPWITRPVKVGRDVVYPTTLMNNEEYFSRRLAKKQYYES